MNQGHWQGNINTTQYGFIYIITNNISGRQYIGLKVFRRGWETYCSSSKDVTADILLLGKEYFTFTVVSCHATKEYLYEAERQLQIDCDVLHAVDEHGNRKYYNLAINGVGFNTTGIQKSEESKAKISSSKKGKPSPKKGKPSGPSPKKGKPGKPHTAETRAKMSNSQKGIKRSDVTKAKMSASKYNMSDEYRAKLSAAAKIREERKRQMRI